MKVPWQFAGNEEMYKLAVRLYLTDLMSRVTLSNELGAEIGNDVSELVAERIAERDAQAHSKESA